MSRQDRAEAMRHEMVVEKVADLPYKVLACRSERHWWQQDGLLYKEDNIVGGPRGAIYATRTIVCQRCELITKIELWRFHKGRLERIMVTTSYDKAYLVSGATRDDKVRDLVQGLLIGRQMQGFAGLRSVG